MHDKISLPSDRIGKEARIPPHARAPGIGARELHTKSTHARTPFYAHQILNLHDITSHLSLMITLIIPD